MSESIALVGCIGRTASVSMPACPGPASSTTARQLYTSNWFCETSAYAEPVSDQSYILSASHALLAPDTVINPYDETLTRTPVVDVRRCDVQHGRKTTPVFGDRRRILSFSAGVMLVTCNQATYGTFRKGNCRE